IEVFTENDAHNYDNYNDDIVMGVNSVTSLTTCYKSINSATSETVNE
ncbi:24042_t:CDS:1, partial [Gigaspora rosea]